jgi:hypothetical protein
MSVAETPVPSQHYDGSARTVGGRAAGAVPLRLVAGDCNHPFAGRVGAKGWGCSKSTLNQNTWYLVQTPLDF